jgi:hypothetical protein
MINHYYIVSPNGEQLWTGQDEWRAMERYRDAPLDSQFFATLWTGEDDEAHLVGQPINVTHLVNQAIVSGKGE